MQRLKWQQLLPLYALLALALAAPAFAAPTRGIEIVAKDAAGKSASVPLYGRMTAVIIGIDVYANLPTARHLSYAVKDARGVEQVLREHYAFDTITTLYNEKATRSNIMQVLQDQLMRTGPDDGVLVYYAGHGITRSIKAGASGDLGYLVPYDGSFDEMYKNISMQQLKSDVAPSVPAKHVFFVLDACFGGILVATRSGEGSYRKDLAYLREITGEQVRQVLTAGGKDETVLDGGPGGHSVFSGRFIQALAGTEDYVTARELSVKLQKQVYGDAAARGHTQKPLFGEIYGTGDFVFVPDRSKRVDQAQAEVKALEDQLQALKAREERARQLGDEAARREAERETLLQQAALKQAQLREEAAAREAELKRQAEAEATANAQALKARQTENEQRLAKLKLEAQRMRENLGETKTSGYTLAEAVAEVQRINSTLAKFDADFDAERRAQLKPLDEYCNQKVQVAQKVEPWDKMFETEKQYKERAGKAASEAAAVQSECARRKQEVESKVAAEREGQKDGLRAQRDRVTQAEFPVGREQLSWKFESYDPEGETFSVSLAVPVGTGMSTFGGSVKVPRGEAREYYRDPSLVLLQAKLGVKAGGAVQLKTATLRGPGKEYPLEGIFPSMRIGDIELVCLDGGTFQMGDTFGVGDSDEKPVHSVTVSAFCIGKTEVTQAQWQGVMGSNPSNFKGNDRPVEQVSWNDVQQFLKKLNQKTGKKLRLPTEAEWEYAARSGGNQEKYAGTSNEGELGQYAWYDANSGRQTHPVGQKKPNGLGLYDMSGNVWEWCSDWYGSYSAGAQREPTGPSSGSYRVYRGGSWDGDARYARAADRNFNVPGIRYFNLGFRLATVQ